MNSNQAARLKQEETVICTNCPHPVHYGVCGQVSNHFPREICHCGTTVKETQTLFERIHHTSRGSYFTGR